MTSAVPKARPVSQACREKSSSAMMAKSLCTVATGAGSTSLPMIQLASCHRPMAPSMTRPVSASAVDRGPRGALAATTEGRARITIPACAPYLFTGVKLAIVYSFIGVIAGEFVLSGAGIGHRIAFAYNNFDNAVMYGLMLLLITFVGGLNMLLYSWERRIYLRRGAR